MQTTHTEADADLISYIAASKAVGTGDAFLLDLLKASGWSERRIFAAFGAYYADAIGLAVPVRGTRLESARDGFLYLLAFIALGCWATGLGHLFYVLIDQWFPSSLDSPFIVHAARHSVSLELATIIVAFPISLFVNRIIGRQLATRPESADSGVRKWLTYIALVVASVILLGDAIFFLQNFLHGDLTQRFVLDTLVLFAIVGSIFAYYWQTLRSSSVLPQRDRLFTMLSIAVVSAALMCGFSTIGTPAHERGLSLDDQRVRDLSFIARRLAVDGRVTHDSPLRPAVLDEFHDPLTHRSYEYARLDRGAYRLCANFASATSDEIAPGFAHLAGRTCFTFAAGATVPNRTDPPSEAARL
jgi:hypothetical protein